MRSVSKLLHFAFAACLISVATSVSAGLCTLNEECVSCRTFPGGQAHQFTGTFCAACTNACILFGPEKADAAGSVDEAQVATFPNVYGMPRQVILPSDLAIQVANQNPWAAALLITFSEMGTTADITRGISKLTALPTLEYVQEKLRGIDKPNAASMPNGMRGRVSYFLTREATKATITLSSYVVDEDERQLYKVYPDVSVDFVESPPATGIRANANQQKDQVKSVRSLTATSWRTK